MRVTNRRAAHGESTIRKGRWQPPARPRDVARPQSRRRGAGSAAEPRAALAPDTLSGVFITVTLRNVGTAAIVVGLLIAMLTLGTTTDRPFILALLFVVIGLGLRLEAAIRGRNGPDRGNGH